MKLLTLHRIFIAASMLLCVAFAIYEWTHRAEHGAFRTLVGLGLPALLLGVLIAYFRFLWRRA